MLARRTRYALLGLMGFLGAVCVGLLIYTYIFPREIVDYDPVRDRSEILDVFKAEWYWLVPEEMADFSPERVLDTKTPSDPAYAGQLIIKVCRFQGQFCGFVAYYKEASYKGRVLFLATAPSARGKGFGKKMLNYALQDLISQGAVLIKIFTRVNNERALALYKQAGFEETWHNEKYVRLAKSLHNGSV